MKARVIESTGTWYKIKNDKSVLSARLKGKFKLTENKFTNPIAVGDFIEYERQENGDALITKILQRKNYLIRRATHDKHKYHVLASNIDYGLVLFTLKNPETSLLFIDKAIAACESFHIKPILLLNKADLLNEDELQKAESLKCVYEKVGYTIKIISLINNLEECVSFLKSLHNSTILIFGHSGVGKSTLMNKLDANVYLKTQATSIFNSKGRHTTSHANLYEPKNLETISIIDTPGIKELDMVETTKEEMTYYFLEIKKLKSGCKYNNCLHDKEPNCAVKQALQNNEIANSRYENYLMILRNLS